MHIAYSAFELGKDLCFYWGNITSYMSPEHGLPADKLKLAPSRKRMKPVFGRVHWNALILACAIQGVRADDYESESIADEWYDLVRYLVGLGLCIVGLINLYFHQYASYRFVKRYTEPSEIERRVGRVVACEPLLSSTSIYSKKEKMRRMRRKKHKHHEVSVPTFKRDADGMSSTTSYVREEDLESCPSKTRELTEYRILVVYTVPVQVSDSYLCCGPLEKDLAINCTDSFAVGTCASGISDLSEDDSVFEKIHLYRSRSLPSKLERAPSYDNLREQVRDSMDHIKWANESEYFQYFVTATPQPVDGKVDLISLKGQPTSACTPEVLKSHLEQVGKEHVGEGQSCCDSISPLGMGLAISVIVLFLVCFFQIQAMPNPETQRPLGYSVLGGFCVGSTVFGYLFARVLFQQYKQKVFLSAFTVPVLSGYIDKTVSEDTNIIDEEFFAQLQRERELQAQYQQ